MLHCDANEENYPWKELFMISFMTSHYVWPGSNYYHRFLSRDWRKWRKCHCFCCNWGVFWLPCFIFFLSYYLFLLFIIIMGDFNFVSSSYTSTTIQQATISLHCALETSLNNTKWFSFHVDSFACIHLTLERNGLRRFVQHRIKSGRPKRTEIIKFQETTIRFYY